MTRWLQFSCFATVATRSLAMTLVAWLSVGVLACKVRSPQPSSPVLEDDVPATEVPASEASLFWSGTMQFAEVQRVPDYILRWNRDNKTTVESQDSGGASYLPLWKKIRVANINFQRSVRAGRGETVLSPQLQPLGLIYNEAFHAWFDQYAKKTAACKPLIDRMNGETQFKVEKRPWELSIPPVEELAEEAISELVAGLIDYWSQELRQKDERTIPTYETARTVMHLTLTPEHSAPGERWASPEKVRLAADLRISEGLFNMSLSLVESGCDNLLPLQ